MPEIRVEFRRANSWLSRGIEWFGGGPRLSHCASLLADGRYLDARDNVIDGVPAGVQIRHPNTEPGIAVYRATLPVTQTEYSDWESNLCAKITDGYDSDAIRGFLEGKPLLHKAGHYMCAALTINSVQHVSRSWTSAAFVVNAMQRVGRIPFPLPVAAHQITPNAALLILATAGFKIEDLPITGEM